MAASALFTGLFKDFTILFSIIIIHEIGHLLAASYYNFNIFKIYLYPFGGYIKFNDKLNRPIKEELIVLVCGPIFQILYYYLIMGCYHLGFMSSITFNMFVNYHYSLLLFNLLPIFPLDGSKLVNLILSKFISFKQAHLVMIYISYIVLFISLFMMQYISLNVNLYLLLILLFSKLLSESKNHKTIYNRFLLERYLYKFHFTKWKIIKGSNLARIMRDKFHLFVVDDKEVTERQLLKKRYDKH